MTSTDSKKPRRPAWGQDRLYSLAEGTAREVKSGVQMLVGLATLGALVYLSIANWPEGWEKLANDPATVTRHVLGVVGAGLAGAAAVELAYTLFTPRADEAFDPLLLGVASAMLLIAGGIDFESVTLAKAGSLVVLGVVLMLLLAARRWLLPDEARPETPEGVGHG